jgi:hypothetical protein
LDGNGGSQPEEAMVPWNSVTMRRLRLSRISDPSFMQCKCNVNPCYAGSSAARFQTRIRNSLEPGETPLVCKIYDLVALDFLVDLSGC